MRGAAENVKGATSRRIRKSEAKIESEGKTRWGNSSLPSIT
jgi:hypothetical protein